MTAFLSINNNIYTGFYNQISSCEEWRACRYAHFWVFAKRFQISRDRFTPVKGYIYRFGGIFCLLFGIYAGGLAKIVKNCRYSGKICV